MRKNVLIIGLFFISFNVHASLATQLGYKNKDEMCKVWGELFGEKVVDARNNGVPKHIMYDFFQDAFGKGSPGWYKGKKSIDFVYSYPPHAMDDDKRNLYVQSIRISCLRNPNLD